MCIRDRPIIIKTLFEGGYIHGDCMTVTGKTIKENLDNVKFNKEQKHAFNLSEDERINKVVALIEEEK